MTVACISLQRFGLSGCEALLPGLQAMVRRCAFQGVERMEVSLLRHEQIAFTLTCKSTYDEARACVVQTSFCVWQVGMPHRGRLNLLCNLLKKPPGILFGEMVQAISEFHVGDVQYHMGESATLTFSRQVCSSASDFLSAMNVANTCNVNDSTLCFS